MKKFLLSLFGVGALAAGVQVAYSATDSQQFTVSVPKRVTITAPAAATVTLTPAQLTGANVVFSPQTWNVKANTRLGATVTFDTTAFNNTTNATFQQDATLQVTLGSTTGPATWSLLGSNSATTDYATSTGARVRYSSNRNGNADFVVNMTFLAADLSIVTEGDYVTSVVGTATEN